MCAFHVCVSSPKPKTQNNGKLLETLLEILVIYHNINNHGFYIPDIFVVDPSENYGDELTKCTSKIVAAVVYW